MYPVYLNNPGSYDFRAALRLAKELTKKRRALAKAEALTKYAPKE